MKPKERFWSLSSKPSEQFADLYAAAQAMEEGQDKSDLLELFAMADHLYDHDQRFQFMIQMFKKSFGTHRRELKRTIEWRKKWEILLERLGEDPAQVKVIDMDEVKKKIDQRR